MGGRILPGMGLFPDRYGICLQCCITDIKVILSIPNVCYNQTLLYTCSKLLVIDKADKYMCTNILI